MEIEFTKPTPDSDGAELATLFAKEKAYPDDYKGPRAGVSSDKEWAAVRDYNAYKYVRDGVWSYSDFDCYLYAMCEQHYKKGEKRTLDTLKEFQKIMKIS